MASEVAGPSEAAETESADFRDPMEVQEETNFFMLLHELDRAERMGVPKPEFDAIAAKVRTKVDGIRLRLSKLEAEEARLAGIMKEFAKAKKAVSNKYARLEEWAIYCMLHFKVPGLEGDMFIFKMTEVDGELIIDPAHELATSRDALLYPDWVSRSYTWKRGDMRQAHLAGRGESLPPFSRVGKTHKFTMKARKQK